jgi:hypothetical protein
MLQKRSQKSVKNSLFASNLRNLTILKVKALTQLTINYKFVCMDVHVYLSVSLAWFKKTIILKEASILNNARNRPFRTLFFIQLGVINFFEKNKH